MAVQTTLKRSQIGWNVLYLVLMLGLGIWGAYDYWVKYPRMDELADAYDRLEAEEKEFARITTEGGILTEQEKLRYNSVMAEMVAKFPDKTKPSRPAVYDRPLNLWAYVIGCGILGTPWFAWRLLTMKRLGPRLEDDGTLITRDGQFTRDQITGINMDKWMSKSIARVGIDGRQEPLVLDDYVYQDTFRIVGTLAHEFDPEKWTEEAKPVKKGEDSKDDTGESDAAAEVEAEEPVEEPRESGS
ncbi:MAG: hypothetical protein MK085_09120 [Phycisphaerales bacterium]|nr:hypothetical protein [Phycisphaerales bacterium]